MSKFKFVLNRAGVRQLMQSEEMQSILKDKADAALNSLGEGYKSDIIYREEQGKRYGVCRYVSS